MLNLLIANSRLRDVENINKNIDLFKKLNPEGKIFIFHDNSDLENFNYHKDAQIITLNKNIGLFFGRKYLIEHLPETYDDEYFCWLDSDDYLVEEGLASAIHYSEDPNYDMVGFNLTYCIWDVILKLKIFKQIYNLFPEQKYGLRLHYQEDVIFRKNLNKLIDERKIKLYKIYISYVKYTGHHNVEFVYEDNMKLFLEGLLTQHIWQIDNVNAIYTIENAQSKLNHLRAVYGHNYTDKIFFPLNNSIPDEKYKLS